MVVPMPQRYPSRIELRMSTKLRNWLQAAAAERERPESEMIRDAVELMLQERFAHLEASAKDVDEKRFSSLRRPVAQTVGYAT
jgi:Arc/MetJ-type ribon-helix-helix transcriptional regulator